MNVYDDRVIKTHTNGDTQMTDKLIVRNEITGAVGIVIATVNDIYMVEMANGAVSEWSIADTSVVGSTSL